MYLKRKEKWVFYLLCGNRFVRTNMHIESWHKTLKYTYLKGRHNKRVDKLIYTLIEMSKDFKYKLHQKDKKGLISTLKKKISERHKSSKNVKMILHEDSKVMVFICLKYYKDKFLHLYESCQY